MGWEELEIQGGGLVRYLQLHLHQEDSVMVGGVGGLVGYKVATLGMMLLAMVVMLAGELSLANASSVWGSARVRFSKIK